MGTVAKQFLLSAGTGTKRELDPVLAGTGSVATAVTYPLNASGIRRFSPETSNGTVATIPAAPATFSGVGWEMDANISAERIQFLDQIWPASLEFAVTGSTTGPNVTYTMIVFVNGAEIGRHSVSLVVFTGPTPTAMDLTTAEVNETLISSANPRVQIEIYANVTLAAVSAGATTHTVRTNDADSWIDPGDYQLRAQRSLSAASIGVAPTPPRYSRLASKAASSIGVAPTPLKYAKPTARSATAIGITSTPLKYARLASKAATAIGFATRQANFIRLASKAATAIGLPTAARRIEAFRSQSSTAVGVPTYSRAVVAVRTFASTAIGNATKQPLFVRLASHSVTAIGFASQTRLIGFTRSAVSVGVASQTRLIQFTRSAVATGNATMVRAVITIRNFFASALGVASGRIEMAFDVFNRATGGEDPPANPTKAIAGVVRDSEGVPVAGATVKLFRQSDDRLIGTTTSAGDGTYSFARDATDTSPYYVLAFEMVGTETHGVTDRGLIPV